MTQAGWRTLTSRIDGIVGKSEKERVNGERTLKERSLSRRMSDEALDRG